MAESVFSFFFSWSKACFLLFFSWAKTCFLSFSYFFSENLSFKNSHLRTGKLVILDAEHLYYYLVILSGRKFLHLSRILTFFLSFIIILFTMLFTPCNFQDGCNVVPTFLRSHPNYTLWFINVLFATTKKSVIV